jgi:hypothetical protein
MQFTVIASLRAAHQQTHQKAIAEGLAKLGIDSILTHAISAKTKHVACWGWRNGVVLRRRGHEVLVMERGYLGDRFKWTSLAWNGLNNRGVFGVPPDDGGERFRQHYTMKPWKQGGEYVLIMGQVPGDASLQGQNLLPWYQQMAAAAAKQFGLPVKFRPHPVALQKGHRQFVSGAIRSAASLEQDLAGAAAVITYNSNSGVDAVINGVPAIVADQGSMAWDVSAHHVGSLVRPARESWAHQLAWKQWSMEEISSGFALKPLLEVANVK